MAGEVVGVGEVAVVEGKEVVVSSLLFPHTFLFFLPHVNQSVDHSFTL